MTEIMQIQGIAIYPRLNQPDVKPEWNLNHFHTKLRIDAEDAAPIIDKLTAMQEAEMKAVQKKAKGKRAKAADLPIQPEYNDDGEETGFYIVKAGMKAAGTSKKTGAHWARKLPLFDGRGKPLPNKVSIYSGSELILAVEAKPWANPKAEVGVKLYLEAVQVIKLVNGSGASASKFGFGAVEGAEEIETPADIDEDEDDTVAPEDGADEEAYDFD